MPIQFASPGVYIQEVPSGVRTIAGVATSVAAFLGAAPRGPINKATRIYSFADFERGFGGLAADSEMSYGVRQFFLNGGTDAWIVRVVKDAAPASRTLQNLTPIPVLTLTALDPGSSGNSIQVRVDYATAFPDSTFNVNLIRSSDGRAEQYQNVSMNSADARYLPDLVNGVSQLVKVTRDVLPATLNGLPAGTSTSGPLADVQTLLDATHTDFRVVVNGLPPLTVSITLPADIAGGTPTTRLTALAAAIQAKVQAQAAGQAALSAFTCTRSGSNLLLTSGTGGESSSVRVLAGIGKNAAGVLKLGVASGGVEVDAVASIRPALMPDQATLTSGSFAATDLDALPDATHTSLRISLDGYGPDVVDLGNAGAAGANLAAKLADVASRLQVAVRALKPGNPAYRDFTVGIAGSTLVLASGSRGAGSAIAVSAAAANDLATGLQLLAGATLSTPPTDVFLNGGSETPYAAADVYPAFIGSRAKREGLYALEDADIFNLLVLPGITDPGVLADAASYCQERRAFFIVDAPLAATDVAGMVAVASGTDLPKSDHAAVYFPWTYVADPLKNGKARLTPPGGTMAGLYARTDGNRGVWKAPAGTDANLAGVQSMAVPLTDGENGSLNPLGVNCLRTFPVYGAVSWGARTLRGADQMSSEYKYVPVRRLALYIEESLYRGTQWVVFEPNDEPLWAQIRLNIGAFMNGLFRQGAFQGSSPRDAYLVKCDRETTTQDDINRGVVNILVGFAPLKPAEFVVISIQQLAGQIQV
ncbi:MAG: phage tail sheath subtilisin-like domain-containing protein [Candidatus Accumulibacter sp.]|uniref:Phage tail sheath subtilisin-like domain-containing protein n=1 Tax=Candidatus Accumulibacter affinis TaxID=2954384 RepID=A0A935T9W6_9PROT|nr:phage tail sheath subtilisin-like domain-containing protein [Candidatus Accumulibacter affinis]